jgi:hypothetical protein
MRTYSETYLELNERKMLEDRSRLSPRAARVAALIMGGPKNETHTRKVLDTEEASERLADQIALLCEQNPEELRKMLMHMRIYLEFSLKLPHNALKGVAPVYTD